MYPREFMPEFPRSISGYHGEEDAAASLREGMEETLTVWKLGLPEQLRRFFATTNAIENVLGSYAG